MKTAIIGSRSFVEYDVFRGYIDPIDITEIISGGAIGTDSLAARYGEEKGIPVIIHKPNYTKFGRKAPIIRNKDIVSESDCVIAFWDGISKGTKMVIDHAKKTHKPISIYRI